MKGKLKMDKENLVYIDKTTKLNNREYFINLLHKYFNNDKLIFGVNILVALDDVKKANEKIGYLEVDKLLVKIANIFKLHTKKIINSIIARMNGSEFCLFLPQCSDKKALTIAKKIQNDVELLIYEANLSDSINFYLSLYGYSDKDDTSRLLSFSNEVLRKAKLNQDKIYQKSLYTFDNIIDTDRYEKIITKAIDSNSFYFISFKAVDIKHKKIIHNRLSLSLKGDDGIVYRYNKFISIVEKLNLVNKLYNNLLKTIFETPEESLSGFICSFRLPYDYLVLDSNYEELKKILSIYSNNLPFKLIIEIPYNLIDKHFEKAKLYKELLQNYNIEIGIYEFYNKPNSVDYLKDLNPKYIKVDANYLISLDKKVISNIKNTTQIDFIATNVKDKDMLNKLEKIDIYMIQGSINNTL